jgi:hypothetical protein
MKKKTILTPFVALGSAIKNLFFIDNQREFERLKNFIAA